MTVGLVILYTYCTPQLIIKFKKGEALFAGRNFYDADFYEAEFLQGRLLRGMLTLPEVQSSSYCACAVYLSYHEDGVFPMLWSWTLGCTVSPSSWRVDKSLRTALILCPQRYLSANAILGYVMSCATSPSVGAAFSTKLVFLSWNVFPRGNSSSEETKLLQCNKKFIPLYCSGPKISIFF